MVLTSKQHNSFGSLKLIGSAASSSYSLIALDDLAETAQTSDNQLFRP